MSMFAPIAIVCLLSNPTECTTLTGPRYETEQECVNSLAMAVNDLNRMSSVYVAGLTCLEVDLLDQAASGQ